MQSRTFILPTACAISLNNLMLHYETAKLFGKVFRVSKIHLYLGVKAVIFMMKSEIIKYQMFWIFPHIKWYIMNNTVVRKMSQQLKIICTQKLKSGILNPHPWNPYRSGRRRELTPQNSPLTSTPWYTSLTLQYNSNK